MTKFDKGMAIAQEYASRNVDIKEDNRF